MEYITLTQTQFPYGKVGISAISLLFFLLSFSSKGEGLEKLSPGSPIFSLQSEPNLTGSENICILYGTEVGTYSAGGDPGDVYEWLVTSAAGAVIFENSGGDQLETIQVVFSEIGSYTVQLKVRRGTNADYYQDQLTVTVQQGPTLALLPDYLLCAGSPTLLTALDPASTNLSEFSIEWKNIDGDVIGTGNEYLTYNEGFHLLELYKIDASGNPSCLVTASTFVGPPIDFQIIPSSTTICEGGSIHLGLDTPLSGDWFIQKGYTGTRTLVGTGFEIDLASAQLSGPGLYLVAFQTASEQYPDCISERMIGFELVESPQLTPNALSLASSCSTSDGTIEISIENDLDAFYIPELAVSLGALTTGESLTYSNVPSGVYTLIAEKNGCQTTQLFAMDTGLHSIPLSPPLVSLKDETCSAGGVNQGIVSVDFGTTISSGEYRAMRRGRGEITRGTIPTNGQTTFPLSAGTYLLELNVDGCIYPIEEIVIQKAPQVEFTVPGDLNICESFTLTPDSEQSLTYTLTYPDGSIQSISSGQSFNLTAAGAYSIYGESNNSSTPVCPKRIDFNATFSSSISFAPVLAIEKCFAPIRYQIDLQGIPIEEAGIRWYNDQGEIMGRGPEFYPPSVGFYSLLVQPLQSGYCPVEPVEFEVVAPITAVPMDLKAGKICPSPEVSTITLTTNEDVVVNTEWIFYDLEDNREELTSFDGLFEIEVSQPGTYEVVAYNAMGCEIGRNLIPVEESVLLTLPELDEEYGVCSKGKTGPQLNPGEFDQYFWYLGDELVSEESVFVPFQAGEYSLRVVTVDGCEFFETFSTYDACSFEYALPNALVLGDPSRNFQVTLSEGVTEAELFILNRQGTLIHYEKAAEIPFGEPFLQWDGTSGGKFIPSGTYVVVLAVSNPLYDYEEKITTSLLVLE